MNKREKERNKKAKQKEKALKKKARQAEKVVALNVRILKAKELERSQRPQLKKAVKRGRKGKAKTQRPSIITVNINKVKAPKRGRAKHHGLKVLPKKKPQETMLYRMMVR